MRRLLARVLPAAAVCFTAAALLFTSQVFIDFAYAGRPLSWGRALLVALIDWGLWIPLSPLVVWLAERLPFRRGRWLLPLALHVPAAVALGAAKLAAEGALTQAVLGYGRTPFSFLEVHLTLLVYALVVAVTHVSRHYREARERERRALLLETSLARAQVESLKMQLHPHFLFNTLNTAAALMREDVDAADRVLAKLADLLRRTLETADLQEVPLSREMEFVNDYLAIQQTRFGERLHVDLHVAEPARAVLVPTLLLQPLVENAIRHGIALRPGPGRMILRAEVRGDRLVIRIENDGLPMTSVPREGFGLKNLRSRLRALHGDRASFSLEMRPEGGAVATLVLPCAS